MKEPQSSEPSTSEPRKPIDKLLGISHFNELWNNIPDEVVKSLGKDDLGRRVYLLLIKKSENLPMKRAKFFQEAFEEIVSDSVRETLLNDKMFPLNVEEIGRLPTSETLFEVALDTGLLERDTIMPNRYFIKPEVEAFLDQFKGEEPGTYSLN